jgi:ABC-2 type transport system ATP-binding protein
MTTVQVENQLKPVIEVFKASKWYGEVLGVCDVNMAVPSGITGLLGPNGAGKSTLMNMLNGILKPSRGSIYIFRQEVWRNVSLMGRIGVCPEPDTFYSPLTGRILLEYLLRLNGFSAAECKERAESALVKVGMTENADRKIGAYSKGMKQRIKLAQAIAHDPEIVFLDEPLTGLDPIGRRDIISLIREMGAAGKTVLVSSHILHEIEVMTPRIILLHNGRVLAEGDVHEIRSLMSSHPLQISITCDNSRKLATVLLGFDDVQSVQFGGKDGELIVQTIEPDTFYDRLPDLVLEEKINITRLAAPDDTLQAVFDYLVKG